MKQKTTLATKTSDDLGYYSGPASVLKQTNGLVFPNIPSVNVTQTSNYTDFDLTHSNYSIWAYKNSKIDSISVTAKFSINTVKEADYFLGAIHFLRSASKMFFGDNDPQAGVPPVVLSFTHMGPTAFNGVPVVIRSFNTSFEDAYNYVDATDGTSIPIISMLGIELLALYTPSALRTNFTLENFQNGGLLGSGYI